MSGCALIGILDDGWDGLSEAARRCLAAADLVIGSERALTLVKSRLLSGAEPRPMDGALSSVPGWIVAARAEGRSVAVLATGDPLCHGIGAFLLAHLSGKPECGFEILPNVSVFQLACARFHQPWSDVRIASCHARDTGEWAVGATPDHALYPAIRAIALHSSVFLFTGPGNTPSRLARALLAAGYDGGEIMFSVACRLQLPDERLFSAMTIDEAARTVFPEPNVVLARRGEKCGINVPSFGLDDAEYLQRAPDKGLITKREARALALARMEIARDAVIWDIGAGAGSVGIEAARLAPSGHVWAIEKNPDDAANARANARRFRVTNYTLREGKAPEHLDAWPDPDAVFVGGSGGELSGLIHLILSRLKPGGRLVLNFVTLENLAAAFAAFERAGANWDAIQLQASRSQPVLGMNRMAAQNPVWIVTARKPENRTGKEISR
ncbi:MAG: precorrin-6y C5,15-methyltransferase (decarboxylating) subunit CbiE [Candidatus Accumulibacter sp.]|jgi:precorrin-6Y C5,15-methyltransferase (decarboxylating)|nr:precorrin-6y C5,15-methyltransferase (decarboxylating) subunit CbiE [Accumulibacter sp.]